MLLRTAILGALALGNVPAGFALGAQEAPPARAEGVVGTETQHFPRFDGPSPWSDGPAARPVPWAVQEGGDSRARTVVVHTLVGAGVGGLVGYATMGNELVSRGLGAAIGASAGALFGFLLGLVRPLQLERLEGGSGPPSPGA